MKRRDFIGGIGLAPLSLLLPAHFAQAQNDILSPEMLTLSNYMGAAANQALPPDVLEQAKLHVLDTFAAIISGSELLPGQAAFKYIRLHGSKGTETVMASPYTAGVADAAMVNGVMGHADETDDSHGRSRSHPGCAVIPASFAMGEELNISGTHFLRSVTLGYDIGTRLLMAIGGPKFSYESHKSSHSIAGLFGAAAAAGCAASLNAQQMRWLLDYTAQQSSGIASWGRDTDHIEKAFVFGGMPAKNGVMSALLVHSGWNGVNDVLSGPDNYFLATAPDVNRAQLVEKLGERYEITQTDIKKWSVGSPIQGPLDAIEIIRRKNPFDINQVAAVRVRLEPAVSKVVNNRDMPDICLQYMVSVMLLDKTASFKAAHDIARMQNPDVLKMRSKVQLIPDTNLSQFLPVRVAIVEIELNDGSIYTERVDAVRGTPRNPMTRDEVVAKCQDLIAPILGKQQSNALIETSLRLEQVKNIRTVSALLRTKR
jgi:2-methylcitrate dehydratase PrpD